MKWIALQTVLEDGIYLMCHYRDPGLVAVHTVADGQLHTAAIVYPLAELFLRGFYVKGPLPADPAVIERELGRPLTAAERQRLAFPLEYAPPEES